jgi:hypothetical protein
MRKRIALIGLGGAAVLGLFRVTLLAAGVTLVSFGSSLPTNCNAGNIFVKTSATAGLYWCSTPGSPGTWSTVGGGGSGTVTNTGTLTANQLVLGNGSSDVKVLGSLGTTTTVYHGNASGAGSFGSVVEGDQSLSDLTTANVTSSAHGYAPKSPADATKFLNGAATPAYAQVKDSDLSISDITTNNASTTAHGFLPKLTGSTTTFLRADGTYAVPPGTSFGSAGYTFVRKPSDESVTSSTTFQDDDDLKFSIGPNESWVFDFVCVVHGPTTADLKVQITGPSGVTGSAGTASLAFNVTDNNGSATFAAASVVTNAFTFIGLGGASKPTMLLIKGVAVNSVNAGTMTLQWAQNTSDPGAVVMEKNSYVLAQRVQ